MKVLTVFGTRPEVIKMAPVVKALKSHREITSRVCVTAQHRQMLDNALVSFGIVPDYDLDVMKPNQDLYYITERVLTGMHKVLLSWRPDWVLVHGDTTTTFSASLAAFYSRIKIAHVEAGLRTKDIYSPWPEEMNRRTTSVLASLHFAPTEVARANLIKEQIDESKIYVTGNTIIDNLIATRKQIHSNVSLKNTLDQRFPFIHDNKKIILVTAHRRENLGAGIEGICVALNTLAKRRDIHIVFPVHPNPSILSIVNNILAENSNISLIPPQDYIPFVYLLDSAYLVLTDSGGIQEEAPTLNKPVLVMRETTERVEAVEAGTVKLIGASATAIINSVNDLLDNAQSYNSMLNKINPYGDGHSAERIIDKLLLHGS